MNPNSNEERYQKILEENNSTMNLIDSIEQSQKSRRTKARIQWWWHKLTFQSYKNEQSGRKK